MSIKETNNKLHTENTTILTKIDTIASISQSIFTVIAILSTGLWFYMQREPYTRANITHEVTHRQINEDWTWVRLGVTIANPGKRLLCIKSGTLRIQKILPLDTKISDKIKNKNTPIEKETHRVPWPRIGEQYNSALDIKIEPGEIHNEDFEFIIPSYIKTVKLYSSFANQKDISLVWDKITIYDINKKKGEDNND